MKPLELDLARRLDALRERGLERALSLPTGTDFASNDYFDDRLELQPPGENIAILRRNDRHGIVG